MSNIKDGFVVLGSADAMPCLARAVRSGHRFLFSESAGKAGTDMGGKGGKCRADDAEKCGKALRKC